MTLKRTIIYSSPFVPAEWLEAHGFQPDRITPHWAGDAHSANIMFGMCPFARAFVEDILDCDERSTDAVVFTTTCDQMRRGYDIITQNCDLPAFLMNVPVTWHSAAMQRLYLDELQRMSRFMVQLGGKSPSNKQLADVMVEYENNRNVLNDSRSKSTDRGIPLALVGGPLMQQDLTIFDLVEKAGGHIVLDATETGRRTWPAPFDRRRLKNDPLIELVDSYFGSIPDAFRRPNSKLYQWLKRELAQQNVRGVIFHRYLWCDIWHAEAVRLKEWLGVPVLLLDCGDDEQTTQNRTATQIQSFLEMLE